jgi:peptide/nickel transport system permease protein
LLNYLLRKLCYSLLVLWGVATLVFFLFNVRPGDQDRLTPGHHSDPASITANRKALHLDNPIWTRYGLFLNDLSPIGVTGKTISDAPTGIKITRVAKGQYLSLKAPFLGRSIETRRSVSVMLSQALPGTIMLALAAMFVALVVGIALGILAAVKKGTAWDTGAIAASVAGISMPSFFAGLIIAYVFGYLLSPYTGLGMTGSLYEYDAFSGRHLALHNLILPAIALSIRPLAIVTQLTRSTMLDVLSQPYIRTAYAKGLKKTGVVLRHALPNALNPLITANSGWLAELLAGSFFIEYIFGWKGVGNITVDALDKLDFPLVMGAVLLTALIFIIVNLVTDMLCGLLDPRMRQ